MDRDTLEKYVSELEEKTKSTRFNRLKKICTDVFGEPRTKGSHHIFSVPWAGDPRVAIQPKGKDSKPYQVKQVIEALKKVLSELPEDDSEDDDA